MDQDLLKILQKERLLNKEQLNQVAIDSKRSGKSIRDFIIEKKVIEEEKLTKVISKITGFEYVDLRNERINPKIMSLLPKQMIENYQVVAFQEKGELIKVGMVDPNNLTARNAISFALRQKGFQMKIYIMSLSSFQSITANEENGMTKEVGQLLNGVGADPNHIDSNTPVSKIVDVVLKYAFQQKVSDIHIEAEENQVKVRYRIDGVLKTYLKLPKETHLGIVSRIKILSRLKIDESRKPQDGRFYTKIGDIKLDIRVSTMPSVNGEKVVMRLLDTSSMIIDFKGLGIIDFNLKRLKKNLSKTFGMILITGPTGSGKSTTLYACLNHLNVEGVNIVTLEDPVEYFLAGVTQSQVRPEIGYTFASGLRSILRQDPDIVMVGEIRDGETAELAIHAALTGHLVLSTLHTNNSVGAIPRLVDMGVEPFLLTAALNMVGAQRLVKRICPKCKHPVDLDDETKAKVLKLLSTLPDSVKKTLPDKVQFYRGAGCEYCKGKGSKGRVGIYESLEMTPELENLVTKSVSEDDLKEVVKKNGIVTMQQDGVIKALQGLVSLEEVWKAVNI